MNIQVHLYKDSNCDLCKLMTHELIDNPPKGDVIIHHIRGQQDIANNLGITEFPTIIITDGDNEITRHNGFVDSDTIDLIIEEYETKRVV